MRISGMAGSAVVLAVDDSPVMLDALRSELSAVGLKVRLAQSGEDCLRSASESPPDIILLDVMMPGIDGFETCRQLKQDPVTRDIPVIFMTALTEPADKLRGFEVGGVDFLSKPIDLAETVARLGTHLLLRQRNQELSQAMDRLLRSEKLLISGKLAAAGQISAGVAHEISNPCQFATMAAQQLQIELADFRQFIRHLAGEDADPLVLGAIEARFQSLQSQLATIREGTERIYAIAQDLRVFARKDDGGETRGQLGQVLSATVSLVRAQYRHDIEIELELIDDPMLPCRPARLGQVFMNLLINACQAIERQRKEAPAGYQGRVHIESRIRDGKLCIAFTDNGCGISATVKAHMFEPFFTTKPAGEGTGLGMTMAHAIINEHGGSMRIESIPGQGSNISLLLPL